MYPLDLSVYDWAVAEGYFSPKRADQGTDSFKLNFSSASQPHFHFVGGELRSDVSFEKYRLVESGDLFRVQMPAAKFPSAVFSDRRLLDDWIQGLEIKPPVSTLERV